MEIIEDVNDLFFSDAETVSDDKKKFFEKTFGPRQIGSLAKYIEPISITDSLSAADELFKDDPKLSAIPVKDNDNVIGIIERKEAESATKEAMRNFTTTSVDFFSRSAETDFSVSKYIHRLDDAVVILDASDYIEKNLKKITEIRETYGLSDFLVFDNKTAARKYLGVANLNDILNRVAEIREQDLQKATDVQSGLFPTKENLKSLPYKIFSWHRMANSLGGDIYQVMRINEDESFVGLFDVSGKNVAASLITIAIASFFKITDKNSFFSNKPSTFVNMLDKYISSIVPEGTFVTGVVCYFNTSQNVIYIYNCGHTIAYLLYSKDEKDVKIASIQPSLSPFGIGMVAETLSKKYEKTDRPFTVLKYKHKMHICMYSDGLTDMHNNLFQIFDEDGVRRFVTTLYSVQDEKVEEQIKRVVENFTSDTLIPDDITVVDIRL